MNLSEVTALRQHNRLLRLSFASGAPAAMMVVHRFTADEGISRDFEYVVEVLCDSARISVDEVHGKKATVSLVREDGTLRHFNGHVFEFRLLATDGGFATYRMVLRPWLAFARLRRDSFLFHGKTVEDQTAEIFADYPADWRTRQLGADPVMTDACQADESDHNYLHRRWEALGWHYWYEHSDSGHTLVLSGDSTAADPIDGDPAIPYRAEAGSAEDDALSVVAASRIAAAASAAVASFDFKQPRPAAVDVPTFDPPGAAPALEDYRWHGGYGFKNLDDGDAQARLRMQEIEAGGRPVHASGNDRFGLPGRWFTLSGHFDPALDGTPLLIVSMLHEAHNNFDSDQPPVYRNELTAVRKATPWHPGRGFHSIDTQINAPQTATVVGPPGEEIHTDAYGRVRVQFHWDRVGGFDHRSSAWLRVVTAWSGASFGMTHIPRVGTEVVVQFLGGNPDRPIITGMVPNEVTLPPWPLPENKTQSGILSRSTPAGVYENANALRFEDKMGAEQLWLHAERDQLTEVEHDEDKWVGNDRRKTIDRDETSHIRRDRTETVDRDERITVHGERIEEVDGDETITVHANRRERVDHDEQIDIGDNRSEQVGIDERVQIGRHQNLRVGTDQGIEIGHDRSKTVGASEKAKIGSNWTINVGQMKTETIGAASMQSVGMAKMVNVGMAYNLNVGGLMATVVGMNQTTKVVGSRELDVGSDQHIKVGKKFTIHAGDEFSIECGQTKLMMKSDGSVFITGKKFNFTAQGEDVEINGRHIFLNPEGGKAAVQPKGANQAPAAPSPAPSPSDNAAPAEPPASQRADPNSSSLVDANRGSSANPFSGMTLGGALGTVSQYADMASQLGIGGKNMALLGQVSGIAAGAASDASLGQLAQSAVLYLGQGGEAEPFGGLAESDFGDLDPYLNTGYDVPPEIGAEDTGRESARFEREAAQWGGVDDTASRSESEPSDASTSAPQTSTAVPRDATFGSVDKVFSRENLQTIPSMEVRGAADKELGQAMTILQGRRDPSSGAWEPTASEAEIGRQLAVVARARGVPFESIEKDYHAFTKLVSNREAAAANKGSPSTEFIEGQKGDYRVPLLSMESGQAQSDNSKHMASIEQLRFGKLVGDSLGIDPVFGALLSPTGGIPGAGNKEVSGTLYVIGGGKEVVVPHGIAHDAGGYLLTYHGIGPGYHYVPGSKTQILDRTNPLAGQYDGTVFFYNVNKHGSPDGPIAGVDLP